MPQHRGKGLAIQMLEHLLSRPSLRNVKYIHTTISPSNKASEKMFMGLAKKLGANIHKEEYLQESDFMLNGVEGDKGTHEAEILYKIGPVHIENIFNLNQE